MQDDSFIMMKPVDKSVLRDGFNIPISMQKAFYETTGNHLEHGESTVIKINIDGATFQAKLTNINFNRNQWGSHSDLLQIRYSSGSPLAKKLKEKFAATANYIEKNENPAKPRIRIAIPSDMEEKLVLYYNAILNEYSIDCMSVKENITHLETIVTEDEFEGNPVDWVDPSATIEEREKLIKIRKLDRSICDNLKKLYDYRCQVTGEKVGFEFGEPVIEAHHIHYFVESHDNDASNIIILSPNFHRIIHKNKPEFDRKALAFRFENGVVEKLKLNQHLQERDH